ncbi:MAG: exodeoxyribonuclease III [Halieaceae bacterium]|jgi:exodeoxyribonuclease-3
MRVISLVTEGLERAAEVGGLEWLFAQDADIICLQDTRCAEHMLRDNAFFPDDYHPYFLDHYEDPRVNGVAIYCKQMPKAIIWGLGFDQFDSQGLYIQADYNNVSVGSVLVPSGLGGPEAMASKMDFLSQLSSHLEKIRNKRRGYILCGGWELMAHHADAEDAGNSTSLPGLSASERGWLLDLLSSGYADAYSEADPEPGAFTWWPDGDDAGGLRTDTHIISELLVGQVERGFVYDEHAFSRHAPVVIDYDLTL